MCESTINEALEILESQFVDLEEALDLFSCSTEEELDAIFAWAESVIEAASDEESREQNEKETVYGT